MKAILVDSDASAKALMGRIDWKKHGVTEVFATDSMQEAQKHFQENTIDILVSDIEIAEGNGFELFEWAKSNFFDVECIYITSHDEFDYLRRALQLGSVDYVRKPLNYRELDKSLSEAARRVRFRHGIRTGRDEMGQGTPGKRDKASIANFTKVYVREHIQEKIHIADIADLLSMSEWNLMRAFKSATGGSISQFIVTERLWLAKELLSITDYPVKQISRAVGYGNHSYFIRMFKESTGATPKAYRLAHKTSA